MKKSSKKKGFPMFKRNMKTSIFVTVLLIFSRIKFAHWIVLIGLHVAAAGDAFILAQALAIGFHDCIVGVGRERRIRFCF